MQIQSYSPLRLPPSRVVEVYFAPGVDGAAGPVSDDAISPDEVIATSPHTSTAGFRTMLRLAGRTDAAHLTILTCCLTFTAPQEHPAVPSVRQSSPGSWLPLHHPHVHLSRFLFDRYPRDQSRWSLRHLREEWITRGTGSGGQSDHGHPSDVTQ